MPKPKGYLENIPRIYKFQYIDLIIFGYVQGAKGVFRDLTIYFCIKKALEKFELCEETYCFNACKSTYYKVLNSIMFHNFNTKNMPKQKGYTVDIERLYKFQAIDLMVYGYVQGARGVFPNLTITAAIKRFLKMFDIDEDTYSFDYAYVAYYRVLGTVLVNNDLPDDEFKNIIM